MNVTASPAEHLEAECQAASQLVELLKREQAQLIEADIQGLTALTEEKSGLIGNMSSLAAQRHQRLTSAGFDASENGMQDWLKTPAAKENVRALWTRLRAAAQSAKELNRVNGLLISKHISRNQDALNTLNLHQGGGNFYGPNGQSTSRPGSRNLVIG